MNMIRSMAKIVERGLLLVCLLAAADGATHADTRAPLRICSEHSCLHPSVSSPRISPGIAGGRDGRGMAECILAMERSTSHSRRLNGIGDRHHHAVHAAHDGTVYEPGGYARKRDLHWSPKPVTCPPPLRTDVPDGEHTYTYIKTKLYPHLSF
ncbi:hypothetical protein T484DRAFT_1954125 [Baffinella frigidus]|nr:hypothetical protein T484DRAFT_1954125 [Cryptophyta sp. CCMP2293]|mmetsp:Transcript_63568/g.151585  ORF Transcript_63568/g.151585 Transcript_63568/m.151585 type:complete len:153 (+) Transcript_63568:24-482(+)